jgi:hypothetical protein
LLLRVATESRCEATLAAPAYDKLHAYRSAVGHKAAKTPRRNEADVEQLENEEVTQDLPRCSGPSKRADRARAPQRGPACGPILALLVLGD